MSTTIQTMTADELFLMKDDGFRYDLVKDPSKKRKGRQPKLPTPQKGAPQVQKTEGATPTASLTQNCGKVQTQKENINPTEVDAETNAWEWWAATHRDSAL